MSDSLQPHGLYSPWNSLGQNTGVGSLSLLQRIFPTQGSNPGLLHYRWILYQLSHKGQETQLPLLRSPEQKPGTAHAPYIQHHLTGRQTTEAITPAQLLDTSLPSPHKRNKLAAPSENEQAREPIACSHCPLLHQGPQ